MKKIHVFTSTLAVLVCLMATQANAAAGEPASKHDTVSTLGKMNAWSQHGGLARAIDGGLRGELHLTRSSADTATLWQAPTLQSFTAMGASPSSNSGSEITPYTESRLSNASMSYLGDAAERNDAVALAGSPAPELGAATTLLVAIGLLLLRTRQRYSQKFTR